MIDNRLIDQVTDVAVGQNLVLFLNVTEMIDVSTKIKKTHLGKLITSSKRKSFGKTTTIISYLLMVFLKIATDLTVGTKVVDLDPPLLSGQSGTTTTTTTIKKNFTNKLVSVEYKR